MFKKFLYVGIFLLALSSVTQADEHSISDFKKLLEQKLPQEELAFVLKEFEKAEQNSIAIAQEKLKQENDKDAWMKKEVVPAQEVSKRGSDKSMLIISGSIALAAVIVALAIIYQTHAQAKGMREVMTQLDGRMNQLLQPRPNTGGGGFDRLIDVIIAGQMAGQGAPRVANNVLP